MHKYGGMSRTEFVIHFGASCHDINDVNKQLCTILYSKATLKGIPDIVFF